MAIEWSFSNEAIKPLPKKWSTPTIPGNRPSTQPKPKAPSLRKQSLSDAAPYLPSRYPNSTPSFTDVVLANQNQVDVPSNTLVNYYNTIYPNAETGGGGGWSFGGGGYSASGAPKAATWSDKYKVDNAPSWWKGFVPSVYDAKTSYLAMMNSLIPTMSAEDQQSTATYLFNAFPKEFQSYNPESVGGKFTKAPEELTSDMSNFFNSKERAKQAMAALDTMVATMVGKSKKPDAKAKAVSKLGAGYRFLRSVINTMDTYGGKDKLNNQTRRQYLNQMSQLDPLLSMAQQGELAAFKPIAEKLARPYFTAGQLNPIVNGKFGKPNAKLFG
jgi:hypothetical protein